MISNYNYHKIWPALVPTAKPMSWLNTHDGRSPPTYNNLAFAVVSSAGLWILAFRLNYTHLYFERSSIIQKYQTRPEGY